jgi:hypothetical protein
MEDSMTQASQEKMIRLRNKTNNVIVSGAIRIQPRGKEGDTIVIAESKISEGLKKIIPSALEKTN